MTAARKRHLIHGVFIAAAALLCVAMIFAVRMAFSYAGKCGGFFPGVSAPRPCSLWEYMTGDVVAIAVLTGISYWPVLLMLMIAAVLLGHFLDKRGRHGGAL